MVKKDTKALEKKMKEKENELRKRKTKIQKEIKQYNDSYAGLSKITPKAIDMKKRIDIQKAEYYTLKKELERSNICQKNRQKKN